MEEGAPKDNNEEEKYTVEHHPTDKDGITEDIFINKETGFAEKFALVLPDGRRVEAILNPETRAVERIFAYDKNGSLVEFVDQKTIDNINHEWAVTVKKTKEQERDYLFTKLMFENLALLDEIKTEFGKGLGRQFGQEKERGN